MCGYVSEHEFESVWHACVCVCECICVSVQQCKCEVVCVMSACVCVCVHMQMVWKGRVRRKGISQGILRDLGVGERQGSCEVLGVADGQGSLACCSPWGCKDWTRLND